MRTYTYDIRVASIAFKNLSALNNALYLRNLIKLGELCRRNPPWLPPTVAVRSVMAEGEDNGLEEPQYLRGSAPLR